MEITLILNTHMPYVLSKGNLFDEPENWLFEAITETYIPLFETLNNWKVEDYSGKKIILSLTPCLLEQLQTCKPRYREYLKLMQKIALFEVERTQQIDLYNKYQKHPKSLTNNELSLIHKSAQHYLKRINHCLDFIEQHDFIPYIRKLLTHNRRHLEVWTSTPNHNFLPFYQKNTAKHFIQSGIKKFEDILSHKADGFWLPECAFMPGLEEVLIAAGVKKTALVPSAIESYHPGIKSGLYKFKQLELLIHDFRLSMHVWQAPKDTLPSNPVYREFYRDMGLDVTADYFKDLNINITNTRQSSIWSGFKYFANSGSDISLGKKHLYDWSKAHAQTKEDVKKFVNTLNTNKSLSYDEKSFILAFDTELFGHWWHEGISWMQQLLSTNLTR